jgi:hypothetical protein
VVVDVTTFFILASHFCIKIMQVYRSVTLEAMHKCLNCYSQLPEPQELARRVNIHVMLRGM